MASEPDAQLEEPKATNDMNTPSNNATELEPQEDESEEEDVDFNPFLKESLLEDASSSLSSEVDVLDADIVDSHGVNSIPFGIHDEPKLSVHDTGHACDDAKELEHTNISNDGQFDGKQLNSDSVLITDRGNGTAQEREIGSSSGTDGIEDDPEAVANARKAVVDSDDEDAICKRTRARYSLAGFTLDELETFLQETDDEDDIHNVDEEEVYRKFLAAVLQGENGDNQENVEGDDDDDNDADFEIEIEEALESDVEECLVPPNKDENPVRPTRRPETRQNRRQKANVQTRKKLVEKGNRPLRPLLPVIATAPIAAAPLDARYPPHFPSQDYASNGFTTYQIGQLHSLIYEHVQLLIQIYSLSVLEPSRQHIASQLKGLLSEMLHKRDLVLAWRKAPYPNSCFLPLHIHPSTSDETRTSLALDDSGAISQGNDGQVCRWLPFVGGSVLSVLDVAPLKLVGRYIDDVSNAIKDHQRRCVEATNIYLDKQPLFPLAGCSPLSEANYNVSRGDDPTKISPNCKVTKKTLAATLVESTKKQSVALVPRKIAKLAQPFYPLFNPALFPHKPPSSAVASRFLFTDAEDELLAMGMMEYNNDWKAIQQRFLPCKSEHQIFVRAKNRCSSKAPENPIKAVRKMKTSPLTEEEKARIHEGLKAYKLDWTSIWKFIVPYRDPNLLCRQWRMAIGTQKSYKSDPIKKEKRRIYESNRRRIKAAALKSSPIGLEKQDDHTEYSGGQNGSSEDEAYLHEAFLADWRPNSSEVISSKISASNLRYSCLPPDVSAGRGSELEGAMDNNGSRESQRVKSSTHDVSAASRDTYQLHCKPLQPSMPRGFSPSKLTSKPFVSESLSSHRIRKPSNSNLVRLAPELPPVKLPPAVRVISQASLRGSQLGTSTGNAATSSSHQNPVSDPLVINSTSNLPKHVQDTCKKSSLVKNGCPTEGGPDLDPQMHPLLFRTLEEGNLTCYPLNSPSRIPTFSFFPGSQNHINLSLLRNPPSVNHTSGSLKSLKSKETAASSSNLDFHPLLQRNDGVNANSIAVGSNGPFLSTDLELSRDGFAEDDIINHSGATVPEVGDAATRPSGSRGYASDLDLDIHLNSASKKRKLSSGEGTQTNLRAPLVSTTQVTEGAKERSDIHGQYPQLVDHHHVDSLSTEHCEKPGSTNVVLLGNLDDYSSGCFNDNVGDQPLTEIVMEQEELSDSDEEIEEVEFECEEMADSEGEEDSDNEVIINAQNKEEQSEPTRCRTSEQTHVSRDGRDSELDSAGPTKGSTRTWLSLNSRGSNSCVQSRAKSAQNPNEGTLAQSHPIRNNRRATSSMRGSTKLQNHPHKD